MYFTLINLCLRDTTSCLAFTNQNQPIVFFEVLVNAALVTCDFSLK